MVVTTFQKGISVTLLKNKALYPYIDKSDYIYDGVNMMKAYNIIMRELRKKEPMMEQDENCIWAWVQNPCIEAVNRYIRKGYTCIVLDIDPQRVVFSDYDIYTDFVIGDSESTDFIIEELGSPIDNRCIQVSFTVDAVREILSSYKIQQEV